MIASTPPGRSPPLFSAMALLTLAASVSVIGVGIPIGIIGCKSNQPASSPQSSPVASVPSTATPSQPALPVPFVKQHIYSETADPTADIAAALKKDRVEHKRVLLDFGGDWCGDCQVLDIYFHQSPNAALLAKHFVLVHVYIGRMDRNLDVPEKYKVPIHKGVPALAVLDTHGKLLFSQQTGEFENMRNMSASSV